jgi:hypothetical protein
MPQGIQTWLYTAQALMQRLALALIVSLAAAALAWTLAAALGWTPWLRLQVHLGEIALEAGMAVQVTLALLLTGLCFFLPTNARVMQLERSHREFSVSMWDVARAYQAVHSADREGAFELKSEYDSVRDRLNYLRQHSELDVLEPRILEIAAQMSHESRDLAEAWSVERVERARAFLKQRQEEAQVYEERVAHAQAVCREIREWLGRVEMEEATARSQLRRLKEELDDLLPELDLATRGASPGPVMIAAE